MLCIKAMMVGSVGSHAEPVSIRSRFHRWCIIWCLLQGPAATYLPPRRWGVFESTDGGEIWRKRIEGIKEVLMVICLAIDPQQPQTLYAGTSGGVYKSVDGAQTWNKINAGLVDPDVLKSSRSLGVTRIKVDPFNPDRVYTATLSGLYQTRNAGKSWTRIGESLPDHMFSELLLDPQQAGVLYVGHREEVRMVGTHGRLETWV